MPFILNEDKALKQKLTGLTVLDNSDTPRPVPVYYRLPELETRAQTYPFITLDLTRVQEDTSRAHRGYIPLETPGYVPEGSAPAPAGHVLKTEFPTPYDLYYQITTWSRYAQHDRALLGVLLTQDYLPYHTGYLDVVVSDTNKTTRRLDVLGMTKADIIDGNAKRVFRNIFNIKVSSELFVSQVNAVQAAEKVILSQTFTDTGATTDANGSPLYINLND